MINLIHYRQKCFNYELINGCPFCKVPGMRTSVLGKGLHLEYPCGLLADVEIHESISGPEYYVIIRQYCSNKEYNFDSAFDYSIGSYL